VLIADDHPLFRIGLRYTLHQQADVIQADVIAEVGSSSDAITQATALKPDVVLLDIGMPGDGIAACQHIGRHIPNTIIVMLASKDEYSLLPLAKHAGAHGFVDKDTNPENFLMRVADIVSEPQEDWFPVSELPSLTRRERQVLELMAIGNAKKDIAAALGISPETVKDYVRTLYRKLDVKDRLLAVQRAHELGLLRDLCQHTTVKASHDKTKTANVTKADVKKANAKTQATKTQATKTVKPSKKTRQSKRHPASRYGLES